MSIEEYIKQQYPNASSVEAITVDGVVKGYFATGINGYDQLYIPTSALNNSNVGMVSYIPGAGGSGNDAAALRDRIHSGNPPDYIITIASSCGDKQNCMNTGYQAAQALNANVTNNVTVCFSASGYIGLEHTEEFLRSHPDVSSTVISCEPYPYGSSNVYNCDADHISAMVQNGTKVIFVAPKNFHINMQDEISHLNQNGLDAYWLQTNYSGTHGDTHVATSRDILSSGILDYILGYSDDFNHEPGGKNYSPGYDLIGYDEKTGQYVRISYEELIQSGVGVVRIPDISKLKAVDNFEIKTKESPVPSKYAGLKNLTTDAKIESKSGRKISSDYEFVSTSMNKLKSQIKNSSFLTGLTNLGFRSSSGIPGCIAGYINTYFDIVGSLMNSLSMEADAIISYGQAYVDMEDDMKKGVDKIGTIEETDNSSKYIPIGLPEETEEPEKPGNTNPNPSTPNGGNSGSGTPSGGGSSSGTPSGGGSSSGTPSGGGSSSPGQSTPTTPTTPTTTTTATTPTEDPIVEVVPTTPTQPTAAPVVTTPEPVYYTPQTPAPVYQAPEPAAPVVETPASTTDNMAPTDIAVEGDAIKGETIIGGMPEIDVPKKENNITQIPVSSEPIPTSSSKKGNGILPVVAGLSVAAAAGIGAKAYIDHKKNNEISGDDYSGDYEYDSDNDMEFQYKEDSDPEFQENEEIESYTSRNTDDLLGM